MPDPNVSLRGIASSLVSEAAKSAYENREMTMVGSVIEKLTGRMKQLNIVTKAKLALEQKNSVELEKQVKIKERLARVDKILEKAQKQGSTHAKSLAVESKKLSEELKEQTENLNVNAEASRRLNARYEELSNSGSLAGNALRLLSNKYLTGAAAVGFAYRAVGRYNDAGRSAAAIMVEMGEASHGLSGGSALAAKSVNQLDQGLQDLTSGNYWKGIKEVGSSLYNTGAAAVQTAGDMTGLSNTLQGRYLKAIKDSQTALRQFGYSNEEAAELFNHSGSALASIGKTSTPEAIKDLTIKTDILAKSLAVDTGEALEFVTEGMHKLGKTAVTAEDSLAAIYETIKVGNDEAKKKFGESIFSTRRFTQSMFSLQNSTSSYNLNLKSTATLMANLAMKSKEFGASNELAMKTARSVAELTTGKAPEFVKYYSSENLMKQISALTEGRTVAEGIKAVKEKFELADERMAEAAIKLTGRAKGGSYSAKTGLESMLSGTTQGIVSTLNLVKQYSKGQEGGQILEQVFGLDRAEATNLWLQLEDSSTSIEKLATELKERGKGAVEGAAKEALETKPLTAEDLVSKFMADETMKAVYKLAGSKPLVDQMRDALDSSRILMTLAAISASTSALSFLKDAGIFAGLKSLLGLGTGAAAASTAAGVAGGAAAGTAGTAGVVAGGGAALGGGAAATGGIAAGAALGAGALAGGLGYAVGYVANEITRSITKDKRSLSDMLGDAIAGSDISTAGTTLSKQETEFNKTLEDARSRRIEKFKSTGKDFSELEKADVETVVATTTSSLNSSISKSTEKAFSELKDTGNKTLEEQGKAAKKFYTDDQPELMKKALSKMVDDNYELSQSLYTAQLMQTEEGRKALSDLGPETLRTVATIREEARKASGEGRGYDFGEAYGKAKTAHQQVQLQGQMSKVDAQGNTSVQATLVIPANVMSSAVATANQNLSSAQSVIP